MKKEVDLWMEDDKPKGMIYDGDFYFITDKRRVTYEATITQKIPTIKQAKPKERNAKKGFTLDHHKKMGVTYIGKCEGLRIVKELIEDLKGVFHETQRKTIIKRYYPMASDDTLKRYSSTYAGWERGKGEPIKPRKKRRRKRKSKRKAPEGTYGYSKIYKTFIKDKEAKAVMRAVRTVRYNYKPTTKAIIKETGMQQHRVLATLKLFLQEDKIGYKLDDKIPIYFVK